MQKPMSSDKDGSTTWFFPMPFFNDDFLPSVTVNDNWFAASSSKLQAVDLLDKAAKGGKPGNEIQTPMAIVILFGLVSSTFLNMIVVPALYLRFGSVKHRLLVPTNGTSSSA